MIKAQTGQVLGFNIDYEQSLIFLRDSRVGEHATRARPSSYYKHFNDFNKLWKNNDKGQIVTWGTVVVFGEITSCTIQYA